MRNRDNDRLQLTNWDLLRIFEGTENLDPYPEIEEILQTLMPGRNLAFIRQTHQDLTKIFQGNYKDFRNSHTKYHDIRHTRNVALATTRLFHGLMLDGKTLSPEMLELCLICAYFHDSGMLLTGSDSGQVGAAYLKSHEERSIAFVTEYLTDHNHLTEHIGLCTGIINSTNLTIHPKDLVFESEEHKLAGHTLGTADILAQMADRYYLEALPLLYQEQLDAGIELYESSLELMRQTTKFYHAVIEDRLRQSFGNICHTMQNHFRERWQIDSNLYSDNICKNIKYLEDVVQKHDRGEGGINNYLRRKQPKL